MKQINPVIAHQSIFDLVSETVLNPYYNPTLKKFRSIIGMWLSSCFYIFLLFLYRIILQIHELFIWLGVSAITKVTLLMVSLFFVSVF